MGRFLEEAMTLNRRRKRGSDEWPEDLKKDLKELFAKIASKEVRFSQNGLNWTSLARLVLSKLPDGQSIHTTVRELQQQLREATDGKKPPQRR